MQWPNSLASGPAARSRLAMQAVRARCAIACGLLVLAAGCGQKGPLTQAPTAAQPAAAAGSAPLDSPTSAAPAPRK